jgi:hypothetical protein
MRKKEWNRWNIPCKHKCPCGVEMVGTEPDLETWLNQHLIFSQIHKNWVEEFEMTKLQIEFQVDGGWK